MPRQNTRLTAKIMDVLTDQEKDLLMNHRIQLRRRGKPAKQRIYTHAKASPKPIKT